MTRRATTVTATAAAVIATAALLARPLIPGHRRPGPSSTVNPSVATAALIRAADAAARSALACSQGKRATCGWLRIATQQATCRNRDRCTVEIVAALHTTKTAAPIALTVTLIPAADGWRAEAVSS
jgi:hypothetical protein